LWVSNVALAPRGDGVRAVSELGTLSGSNQERRGMSGVIVSSCRTNGSNRVTAVCTAHRQRRSDRRADSTVYDLKATPPTPTEPLRRAASRRPPGPATERTYTYQPSASDPGAGTTLTATAGFNPPGNSRLQRRRGTLHQRRPHRWSLRQQLRLHIRRPTHSTRPEWL
jgi:hypothetical protein